MQGSGPSRREAQDGQALSAATAAAQSRAMLSAVGSGQPPAKKRRRHRELQSLLLDQVHMKQYALVLVVSGRGDEAADHINAWQSVVMDWHVTGA